MPKTAPAAAPKDFESAMRELEQVVARMESGSLSLDESMAAYRRGLELSAFCRKALAEAELQVQILEQDMLKDFPAGPTPGAADD